MPRKSPSTQYIHPTYIGQQPHSTPTLRNRPRRRGGDYCDVWAHAVLLLLPQVCVGGCRESSFLFQINTSSFLKRCFSPCLLCGGLVETGDSGDELYGFCWVGLTYVIILGVAANLNEYFILPQGYKFENTLMLMSIGLSSIFQLLGVFVYGAIVKCLNSQLTFIQVHVSPCSQP